jgi:hypothetical protein
MAPEKQDEPTKSQSDPVKPSQTSLMTPISPKPLDENPEAPVFCIASQEALRNSTGDAPDSAR